MSVYFSRSGYADHHVEKFYRSIEKFTNFQERRTYKLWQETSLPNEDHGMEVHVSVLDHTYTLKEENKRGDWMNQWLMIHNFTALNTMYRKMLEKQAICRTPEGTEKVGLHIGGRETCIGAETLKQTT